MPQVNDSSKMIFAWHEKEVEIVQCFLMMRQHEYLVKNSKLYFSFFMATNAKN